MRKLHVTLAALVTLLVAVPATPAGAATRNKCRVSSTTGGAKIVKRTSSVVMFTKRLAYYGCAYSGGPIKRLLDEGGGIGEGGDHPKAGPQISGRYVAYATRGSAIGDEFDRVVVWDLKEGRIKVHVSSTYVMALAVKANGSVAWTQSSVVFPAEGASPSYEVHAASTVERQGDVLLDRGSDVDPRSLALTADRERITWTRGGGQRSAPLR